MLTLLFSLAASARGQDAPASPPATVEEAAKALDLATLPLPDGAEASGPRRMASLFYETKGNVKTAYDFAKRTLVEKGWTEQPNPYVADESASGTFTRDGFVASVSVFPGDAEKPGTVRVMAQQHGNVDLAKLPVPPGTKPLYAGPVTAMFVTEATPTDAARTCREKLLAGGWQPYGTAGDSLIFKQNAVRLNAMISAAPAQGGKTVINYTADLLSADLPAPPDLVRAHYADSTKDLDFDVKSSPEAVVDFYRDLLGRSGWKPTTDKPIKTGIVSMLIFRNPGREMLTLKLHPIEDVIRGSLQHQSAAGVDELDRLAREEEERIKAARRPRPKAKPTVALALPTDARDVKEEDGDLEFTVAPGKARAAVEALRTGLRQAGWKEDVVALQRIAGTVALSKKDSGSLTFNYADTGLEPAEISITAFGVVIERAKPGSK